MFFQVTYRNWKKYAVSFVLRLLGLTISLSFLIVLLVYILHELSYDNHIKNKENIYRVLLYYNSTSTAYAETPFLPRSLIINNIPEVADLFRFDHLSDIFIKKGDDNIPEKRFYCADFEIFKNLSIPVLAGDLAELDYVYYIALSRQTAEKYFPDGNAVGNSISINQAGKVLTGMVTAVFENIPENSTFQADIIGNFQIQFYFDGTDFDKEPLENIISYNFFTTFITLEKKTDPNAVADKISRMIYPPEKYIDYTLRLQPLKDLYLGSKDIVNNSLPAGSILNIKLFIAIIILIVLIAASNFAIITAIFHYHRKHEYFIRTTHGATRYNIIVLILGEILLLFSFAVLLSIVLSTYSLPVLRDIFQKNISLDKETFSRLIVIFIIILGFIVLIAVLLTFAFISGKKPGTSNQNGTTRRLPFFQWNKLLVLGQIAVFNTLIVISALLLNQWKFLKSNDALDFDPENLLVLELPQELSANCEALVNDLTINPQILSVTESWYIPLTGPISLRTLFITDDYTTPTNIVCVQVGSNYFKNLGFTISNGREFDLSGNYDLDNSIMLNEEAVKFLQLADPVGKKVAFKEVIGVVRDFPIQTMYEKITPLLIFPLQESTYYLLIRYQGDQSEINDYISKKQHELVQVSNLRLNDFTSIIDETYAHEKKLKSIVILFTIIAIILGGFGIIGFLIFTLQKRGKEITIRIIHGASYLDIVSLLSKEFLITLIISNILTYPFIWYFADNWLSNFIKHINISPLYFILGTVSTLFIILVLVSLIVLKYIRQNPIKHINL
jgi:putative ABC transport system permease protein